MTLFFIHKRKTKDYLKMIQSDFHEYNCTKIINKIIMAFRLSAYEADKTNINRLWELQANRTHHLKNLENIYKQKQTIRNKSEKDQLRRKKQIGKFIEGKLKDFDYRNKSAQDKINYENALLRNKILDVYQGSGTKRKSRSIFLNQMDKKNPYKANQAEQMCKTNLKMGVRLSHMKSEIATTYKIQQHSKKVDQLINMIQKKSPKKQAYLKNLTKKKFSSAYILPQFQDGSFLNE